MKFRKATGLRGEITVPGDKSISHRAVMFGSIARGTTEIHNFLQGADCLSTISCFEKMGVSIENKGGVVVVHGNGLHGLKKAGTVLDCGNSVLPQGSYPGFSAPRTSILPSPETSPYKNAL